MRVIAIDWSGIQGNDQRKTIWLAEARDNALVRLENGRAREEIAAYLIDEARVAPRFVVGFDFAFSLPAWFLAERDLPDAPALWALTAQEAETWLHDCAPPFWGRPGKGRPPGDEQFRHADRAVPRTGGIAPKSVFQIGGAGAVGTGSLRGMPILHRLQTASFAIWPFEPPGWPRVVEIYPRLLTGKVTKSSAQARAAYLAAQPWAIPTALLAHAAASEDAFDAAISALLMARHAADLADLPATADPQILREGAIWHPGWRDDGVPGRVGQSDSRIVGQRTAPRHSSLGTFSALSTQHSPRGHDARRIESIPDRPAESGGAVELRGRGVPRVARGGRALLRRGDDRRERQHRRTPTR